MNITEKAMEELQKAIWRSKFTKKMMSEALMEIIS